MRIVAVLLAWWLALGPVVAIAQQTPAQLRLLESLRRELVDKLQASGRFAAITASDPSTLKARSLAGVEMTLAVGNLAAEIAQKPKLRAEFVARFVGTAVANADAATGQDKPVSKDAFVASLRIIIRHADHVKAGGTVADANNGPVYRPFAGDAVAIVALDQGERIVSVRFGAGQPHGIADDDLFPLALKQMRQYIGAHLSEASGPLRVFIAQDESYSPSLLLVDELVAKIAAELGGDFLAAIPDRTVLLVAPSRNAADLRQAVAGLMRQRKASPLIPHLIQRSGAGWVALPAQ